MKLTAPFPVSDQPVKEAGLVAWVNNEATKILRQLRSFANYLGTERDTAATAGAGAYVRVWESAAMPTNGCWVVLATVAACSSSGAAQRAGYLLFGVFESTSGTVAQINVTTVVGSAESVGGIDARFGVDATDRTVYIETRDDATSPMRAVVVAQVNEALPSS